MSRCQPKRAASVGAARRRAADQPPRRPARAARQRASRARSWRSSSHACARSRAARGRAAAARARPARRRPRRRCRTRTARATTYVRELVERAARRRSRARERRRPRAGAEHVVGQEAAAAASASVPAMNGASARTRPMKRPTRIVTPPRRSKNPSTWCRRSSVIFTRSPWRSSHARPSAAAEVGASGRRRPRTPTRSRSARTARSRPGRRRRRRRAPPSRPARSAR